MPQLTISFWYIECFAELARQVGKAGKAGKAEVWAGVEIRVGAGAGAGAGAEAGRRRRSRGWQEMQEWQSGRRGCSLICNSTGVIGFCIA